MTQAELWQLLRAREGARGLTPDRPGDRQCWRPALRHCPRRVAVTGREAASWRESPESAVAVRSPNDDPRCRRPHNPSVFPPGRFNDEVLAVTVKRDGTTRTVVVGYADSIVIAVSRP